MWKGDPLADLDARERYVPLEVHGRAKLLNILPGLALSRRLAGTGVTVKGRQSRHGLDRRPRRSTPKPSAPPT